MTVPAPVELIPLSQIAVLNRQRKGIDPDELKELAASIAQSGLLHPIVVRDPFDHERDQISAGQRYVLSVGGRRLAAHMLLGRETVEARRKEVLDPISAEIVELEENLKRVNLTWQEETEARARIGELLRAQNPTATQSDIAEAIGVTQGQLSKDLTLAKQIKADPSLKQATSKGAAIRAVEHKAHIQQKLANIKTVNLTDIGSKIVTADGRSFLRGLASQSVDLVFSDLPYGIDYFETHSTADETSKGHYDDSADTAKDFIADVVPQCLRVVKPTGWVVFFMCYEWHAWLQELIHDTCNLHYEYVDPETRRCPQCVATSPSFRPELPPWIWTRRGKGNHGHWPNLHASNRYELIVVVNGGNAQLAKKPVENVLDYPPFEGKRLHAMQKPHELCREIIERTTVLGETVLDICFGSGAHLAAAASLGRDFLGCDNNPNNRDSALTLVGQHYNKAAMDAILRSKRAGEGSSTPAETVGS